MCPCRWVLFLGFKWAASSELAKAGFTLLSFSFYFVAPRDCYYSRPAFFTLLFSRLCLFLVLVQVARLVSFRSLEAFLFYKLGCLFFFSFFFSSLSCRLLYSFVHTLHRGRERKRGREK